MRIWAHGTHCNDLLEWRPNLSFQLPINNAQINLYLISLLLAYLTRQRQKEL